MGLFTASNDIQVQGTTAAAEAAVTIDCSRGYSGWHVQITGTFVGRHVFEGSIDGTTFVPISYRQSKTGTLGNNASEADTTRSGMYRGSLAGLSKFRVRMSERTSGSATVTIRASGGTGAIFPNVIQETRTLDQYYANAAGRNMLFNSTSDFISLSGTGPNNIGILENPAASTIDIHISRIVLSADVAGRFRRFRNGTITVRPTAQPAINRGGGVNAGVGKFYAPAGLTVTGGTLAKGSFVLASGSEMSNENGTIVLKPGDNMYWTFAPNTGATHNAIVEVVYWETTATT